MEIIIIGAGKVGGALARRLDEEGHNVTVIDQRASVVENLNNSLDVTCFEGSGTDMEMLRKAGIKYADLAIAVTAADEVNLVCCLLAKRLGAASTIARVRQPEYNSYSWLLKDELRLSMLINPELATAREIIQKLQFSSRVSISTFAKGRMEIARFRVPEDCMLNGRTVQEIMAKLKSHVQFCIQEVGKNELHIPSGHTVIKAGDVLSVTGSSQQLVRFFQEIKFDRKRRITEVMIVGASSITWYLAKMLLDMGIDVRIIESNRNKAERIAQAFPEATVISGDGTDQALLMSENLEDMDAFISLTGNDEENVIVCMFASSQSVNTVIPKVNRVELGFLLEKLGLSSGITPKNIVVDQIVQYVRAMHNSMGSSVESIVCAAGDRVEFLEFRVRDNCSFIGRRVMDLDIRKGVLVAYINHKGRPEIARGNTKILLGDTMIVVSRQKGLRDINDILAGA